MRKMLKWTIAVVVFALIFTLGLWLVSSQMSRPRNATLVCAEDAIRVCYDRRNRDQITKMAEAGISIGGNDKIC